MSARRSECASHLRQFGLALHQYSTTWDCFPAAALDAHSGIPKNFYCVFLFSPHTALLPFLEQPAIHSEINFSCSALSLNELPTASPANLSVVSRSISLFVCPSEPDDLPGSVSYRTCSGYYQPGSGYKGVFTNVRPAKLSSIRDGLSSTIAMSEKPLGSNSARDFRPFSDSVLTSEFGRHPEPWEWVSICGRLGPNSLNNPNLLWLDAGRTWLLPGGRYTAFFTVAPPNTPVIDCGSPAFIGLGQFAARSYHPGGVNGLMSDGSVHWFQSGISFAVWSALGTRGGSEAVQW